MADDVTAIPSCGQIRDDSPPHLSKVIWVVSGLEQNEAATREAREHNLTLTYTFFFL